MLALADLAQNSKGRHLAQVKEIARRQKIPEEYLGQIMVLLKRANLVHGARGPGGGYRLARPAESISVAAVLKALEGPLMGADWRSTRERLRSLHQPKVSRLGHSVETAEKCRRSGPSPTLQPKIRESIHESMVVTARAGATRGTSQRGDAHSRCSGHPSLDGRDE